MSNCVGPAKAPVLVDTVADAGLLNGRENSPLLVDGRECHAQAQFLVGSDYQDHFWLPRRIYDWLFPPTHPRSCQLLRLENIAVPLCYLLVGLSQGLSGPLINVYPLDLGATEAQQTTVSAVASVPATFKIAFGFLSDNLPLVGYRRKSYMLIGWLLASASLLGLIFGSNLRLVQDEDGETEAPADAPSITMLTLSWLLSGTGMWMADVMGDSIIAEKAKLEIQKGHIQSTCYACRFFGIMVAAPYSTVLYSSVGPQAVFLLLAALPWSILPLLYYLREERLESVTPTSEQCREIWNTVCSRAVWQPLGFVLIYNSLQVGNAAWREFLKTVLGFSANQLNALLIIAYVLIYLGTISYKYFFITWSWRSIYIFCTTVNGFFSALQICLITGNIFGLSNFLFALGDDAFSEFLAGVQFLPTTIMMVHLCPEGSEGASYAMFTTVHNSGIVFTSALSTMLLGIWDVSKEALESGDYQGMINLTVLTTVMQTSGLLFVGLLPHSADELAKLDQSGRSRIGGFLFLAVVAFFLSYSLVVGILNTVAPGWAGES